VNIKHLNIERDVRYSDQVRSSDQASDLLSVQLFAH